ncbi:MAG: hypothetical protein F6K40_39280, partial [Okeania sp. SIO3I5]|uniref:hypothetical protein n=1 Tax=Okeania sp. SIO3I5 TaxID=2607805 RepID=UPI0013BC62D7
MTTVPIDWSELTNAIDQLRIAWVGSSYLYTWDNYPTSLEADIPQEIVSISEKGKYQILIANLSNQTISLYLGGDGAENLGHGNSAWFIPPGKPIEIEINECSISAVSPEDSD